MEAIAPPRGLIVDLITPLTPDGAVLGPGVNRLLERVMAHVQGVLLASPRAGEGLHLTPVQRCDLLEQALAVIDGAVPVFMWISTDSTEGTTRLLHALAERVTHLGYQGPVFWVDTPLYHHSNRGLPHHYRALSTFGDARFILYNDPSLIHSLGKTVKRANIRTGVLKELAALDSVAGLIFLGALSRSHNYQKACSGRNRFRIYDGEETVFLSHPSTGGVVSAGANLAPKTWGRVVRSSLALGEKGSDYPDHLHQVWQWGTLLHQVTAACEADPPGIIKQALARMGVLETDAALSSQTGSPDTVSRLKTLLTEQGEHRG